MAADALFRLFQMDRELILLSFEVCVPVGSGDRAENINLVSTNFSESHEPTGKLSLSVSRQANFISLCYPCRKFFCWFFISLSVLQYPCRFSLFSCRFQ